MTSPRRAALFAPFACATLAALAAPATAAASGAPPRIQPTLAVEPELAVLRPRRTGVHLTVTGQLGALDRSTTGTLVGYGYDASVTPSAGVNVQLLFPVEGCHCASHGLDLGFSYAAGPTFGAFHEAAFRHHLFDAAYAWRWDLPCLRRQNRRALLTARVGVAGTWADAGLGDVSRDDVSRANERMLAASRDDHFAVGWRLGGAMDFAFDDAVVGFGLDLRELYGVGTDLSRTFMLGANVRVGADFGF